MRVHRDAVSREDVIRWYVTYDRRKKGEQSVPADLDQWPWNDPPALDRKLKENGLKDGVLSAYAGWSLAELGVADLLRCAIYNGIFPGQPQVLSQLVLAGSVARWKPDRTTNWYQKIR
jgi:hypothetical protein